MRAIRTPNDADGNAIDYLQPGKIAVLTIGTQAVAYPPDATFPFGGALFGHYEGGRILVSMTANGSAWPVPEGWFGMAFDASEEVFLRAAEGTITYSVCQAKEAA